jgi:hypothetical protein
VAVLRRRAQAPLGADYPEVSRPKDCMRLVEHLEDRRMCLARLKTLCLISDQRTG